MKCLKIAVLAFMLLLSAFSSSFAGNTVHIDYGIVEAEIVDSKYDPKLNRTSYTIKQTKVVKQTTSIKLRDNLYFGAIVKSPDKVKVGGQWKFPHRPEKGGIYTYQDQMRTSRTMVWRIHKVADDFTYQVGEYQLTIFINDKAVKTIKFTVEAP